MRTSEAAELQAAAPGAPADRAGREEAGTGTGQAELRRRVQQARWQSFFALTQAPAGPGAAAAPGAQASGPPPATPPSARRSPRPLPLSSHGPSPRSSAAPSTASSPPAPQPQSSARRLCPPEGGGAGLCSVEEVAASLAEASAAAAATVERATALGCRPALPTPPCPLPHPTALHYSPTSSRAATPDALSLLPSPGRMLCVVPSVQAEGLHSRARGGGPGPESFGGDGPVLWGSGQSSSCGKAGASPRPFNAVAHLLPLGSLLKAITAPTQPSPPPPPPAPAPPPGLSGEELARLPQAWLEAEEEGTTCSVCMLELRGAGPLLRLPCPFPQAHVFHRDCAMPWLQQRPTCPLCRINVRPLLPAAQLQPSRTPPAAPTRLPPAKRRSSTSGGSRARRPASPSTSAARPPWMPHNSSHAQQRSVVARKPSRPHIPGHRPPVAPARIAPPSLSRPVVRDTTKAPSRCTEAWLRKASNIGTDEGGSKCRALRGVGDGMGQRSAAVEGTRHEDAWQSRDVHSPLHTLNISPYIANHSHRPSRITVQHASPALHAPSHIARDTRSLQLGSAHLSHAAALATSLRDAAAGDALPTRVNPAASNIEPSVVRAPTAKRHLLFARHIQ